jgi:hypothetical protein
MTDIVVQRCAGDRPGDDIVEPLLSSVPAALSRGRAELDEGTPARQERIGYAWQDFRLGKSIELDDPIAGHWWGKATGIQHSIQIDDQGNVSGETSIDVRVPDSTCGG